MFVASSLMNCRANEQTLNFVGLVCFFCQDQNFVGLKKKTRFLFQ